MRASSAGKIKSNMHIYLATDHAGFALKNFVKEHLLAAGYAVVDCGAQHEDPLDDYPDYIAVAAKHISATPRDRAVIFGGSGQGEAMLANRFQNVRATTYYGGPLEIITLSRQHNDANVLSFGARFVTPEEAVEALTLWLTTEPLTDPKYMRRVHKAEQLSVTKMLH